MKRVLLQGADVNLRWMDVSPVRLLMRDQEYYDEKALQKAGNDEWICEVLSVVKNRHVDEKYFQLLADYGYDFNEAINGRDRDIFDTCSLKWAVYLPMLLDLGAVPFLQGVDGKNIFRQFAKDSSVYFALSPKTKDDAEVLKWCNKKLEFAFDYAVEKCKEFKCFDLINGFSEDFFVNKDVGYKLLVSQKDAPIHKAIKMGNYMVFKLLIKHGADVNLPNKAGETPLKIIGDTMQTQYLPPLVEAGARPLAVAMEEHAWESLVAEAIRPEKLYKGVAGRCFNFLFQSMELSCKARLLESDSFDYLMDEVYNGIESAFKRLKIDEKEGHIMHELLKQGNESWQELNDVLEGKWSEDLSKNKLSQYASKKITSSVYEAASKLSPEDALNLFEKGFMEGKTSLPKIVYEGIAHGLPVNAYKLFEEKHLRKKGFTDC